MKKLIPKPLKFPLIILVGTALIAGSFYLGFQSGIQRSSKIISPPPPQNLRIDGNLSVLWDTWQVVKGNYFNAADLKDQELIYGAAEGVIGALDDPYSIFLRPDDAKKFEEDISGSFSGIGAEIGIRNNKLVIVAPLKGSPAEQAGLRSSDHIIKIDDTFTADLTLDNAVKLIRGERGTTVVLSILREKWDKPKDFAIVRNVIVIPTLDWEMKDGNIAYIQLYNFNENAVPVFYRAALGFLTKGTAGIVLDLRNNPGGFLEVSVNLAGWFLDKGGIVVKEKFSSGNEQVFRANGNATLKDIPLVILVNNGSASASEILAGAIRDNNGVKLIGEKTFGKGTVQELHNLNDGSAIKISVAEWLLPAGGLIEKIGLTPDIEVKMSDEDIEAKRDPQLQKALEIIKPLAERSPIFRLPQ